MSEFGPFDRSRVDPAERHVLVLERRRLSLDIGADIAGFGAEEDVEDKLDGIYLIES